MIASLLLLVPDWALGGFQRVPNVNPIVSPLETTLFRDPMSGKDVAWEANDTFNPTLTVYRNQLVLLYRAEDRSGVGIGQRTSRIGYAISRDGRTFERKPNPVLFPAEDSQKEAEWSGGCEDPRVALAPDGTYVMFYTQWNRKNAHLAVATSKDLTTWTKHGFAFSKDGLDWGFTKSASPVTQVVKGRQVMAKIDGKYWMYWGENAVYAATSTNLVDWSVVRGEDGKPKPLVKPRKGFFDSLLTECGPPAVVTDKGIVLLYNGKNGESGDRRYPTGAYCAGQMLFDKADPRRLLARLDRPFLRPMEPFEKSGQYKDGTVFVEGLAWFRGKWYLAYGCADSRVGLAVYDPKRPGEFDPDPDISQD